MPDLAEPAGSGEEWTIIDGIPHRRVVLCFVIRYSGASREVLLGLKRTGFGAGRVVGIGGKIDGSETDFVAAVRELQEETGLELQPTEIRSAGRITWTFPAQPGWSMAASLFTAEGDGTEPVACEEIEPRWYRVEALPWDAMWKDAPYWLPSLLDGAPGGPAEGALVEARIVMAEDNANVADAVVGHVARRTGAVPSAGPSPDGHEEVRSPGRAAPRVRRRG